VKEDVFIVDGNAEFRALTTDSCLVCAKRGFIEFVDSGQQAAAAEAAALKAAAASGLPPIVGPMVDEVTVTNVPVFPEGDADLPVRGTVEAVGGEIVWHGEKTPPRTMTVITKSKKAKGDPKGILLTEGVDFYIDANGNSYFYNNLKTIAEAQDCEVVFDKGEGKGKSFIAVTALSGTFAQTLREGTDYFLGTDNRSHFVKGKALAPEEPLPTPATETPAQGGATAPTEAPSSYGFIWPTDSHTVSGKFGVYGSRSHLHRGIDISDRTVTENSAVKAVADGVVIVVGDDTRSGGRGIYVFIDHGNGTCSVSEHLSKVIVGAGMHVKQGEQIGNVGGTYGYAIHLHFELLMDLDLSAYLAYANKRIETRGGLLEPPFNWEDNQREGQGDRPIAYGGIAGRHVNPVDYLGK
jgi:murein DD-endopeptidase MepM/ murein hydrolase activator NlpD